jgi:dipeptidyl-peptidase-4
VNRPGLRAVAAALSLTCAVPAQAEPLSVARIHGSEFAVEGPGPLRWVDGRGYARLTPSPAFPGAVDLIRHDTFSGQAIVLISASDLIPEGSERPLRIEDYTLTADGRLALLFTESRRVWRTNSRGDFWVFERESKALRKLGGPDASPSSLQFAKFSPDGSRVAYVRDRDVYVEDLASGTLTRLTRSDRDTLVHGATDWVYEEEFGIRDGFRWSPDGAHIAFYAVDDDGVGAFSIAHNLDAVYPEVQRIPYPKVGTTNPAVTVGVIAASGEGGITWLDLPGDPRDDYVARVDWTPSNEVMVQRLDRRQQVNRVLFADPGSGRCREVFRDSDPTWVEVVDPVHWVEEGRAFLWLSERDGWNHVYVVPVDGTEPRCITTDPFDTIDLVAVEEIADAIWFTASPDDASQRFLYRGPLSGGPAERITPLDVDLGWNEYSFAPGARYALRTASAFDVPPRVELLRMPDHDPLDVLVDNAAVGKNLEALAPVQSEFFEVEIEADGQSIALDGWMVKPPDFDPGKKWPVVVHVYGEPAAQTVVDRWGGTNRLWHRMLAERGYIVVSIDNRGTPAPKGRAWRKSVYGKVGIIAHQDQAAAVRALAAERPYFDLERIGVWGWSGGGSMTLNALFHYPDLYRAGIAIAFVADQRLYDTIYQERYMGLLADNEVGYREGSPITHAHRLEGDVLLVYGSVDDNTHYQNFERLVDALIAHDKPFDALPYPGRTHGIFERANTRRHLYGSMTRWLEEHLPAGAR